MKKTLSLMLVVVLLIGLMPINVFARENETNPWGGRGAVFVGDSITAGSGTTKVYYEYLEESLGFGSVTPMGVAGSCISSASDYGQSNQPLINRYQDIPSADLIVIFMGTNDYGHETSLGSLEDTQDGTFYGALNVIVPALVAKHPSSKIVFVTPLHRYGFGTSKILGTKFTADDIANGVGATMGDYVEALKTVCANNGVSVIDLYTECTLDPANAEIRTNYMPDGLHPNAAGHEVIAGIIESHILGFEPAEREPIEQNEMVYGNKFAPGNNQTCRASSRVNYYLKAGTVITLKDSAAMQWACTKTSSETSSNNLGYFPDSAWSDKETAVVESDGWVGFVFKYRDETKVFDLARPLSEYITIEEPHTHSYSEAVTAPTCTEKGYTTYTCACGDSYVDDVSMDITDRFKWNEGYVISALNGNMMSDKNWVASDYVDISAFDFIEIVTGDTVNANTTLGIAFYNADKKYVSGVVHTDKTGTEYGILVHNLEVPKGVVYLRTTWYSVNHGSYNGATLHTFYCKGTGTAIPPLGHSYVLAEETKPDCTVGGTKVYTCSRCGESTRETTAKGDHAYDNGICISCGSSILGNDWIAPNFAEGDYSMVVLPDTQKLVTSWEDTYYEQMQWIADNEDALNIQAVLHMGDMVDNNTTREWTICEAGTDILQKAGIPWMPMRGNHDNADSFNSYYDYTTYGANQSWFGGAYHSDKLEHTYWFVTVGQREYMILSLGWAPSWDVLEWAKMVVEEHADKNVILTCHAYMNSDGTLLDSSDAHCPSSYHPGYPDGDDVWDAFKGYENVVLAMGGHIHSADIVTFVDQNGTGRDVTSLLVDRQNDDMANHYGMVAVLTFHNDSDTVDVNWYSVRYDALYRAKNQFSIDVPHVHSHDYENGTCTGCGDLKGPVITQQAESVQQEIGKKFAVSVKAEGEGLTYQWYYKDAGMKNFGVSSNKTSAYAYTMQSYMHNRQVFCVITDAYGNQITTETATITRPPVKLALIAQPQSVQMPIGEKFSVKPTVQGDGLTYQWYYKDGYMKEFAVSINKTSAYAYTMQSYMHNRQVYCVITDQYGNSVTTEVATITRPPVELKLLSQTLSVSAALGEKFSVSVKAQGDGLTYQWYYKNAGGKTFAVSSNKTSDYAYSMASYMNGRQVYCVITDQYGNQIVTEVVTISTAK